MTYPDVTLDTLVEHDPAWVQRLRLEGAQQERERIRAVEAQCLPGFEDFIRPLKFDGKTTGEEAGFLVKAAQRVVEQQLGFQMLEALRAGVKPLPITMSWEEEQAMCRRDASPQPD